ncbi:MAG: sulfite exporter TauE/SafE family protein [Acidobacteria bacterium]|nr:sulfite exporter TauE/SafE family protein [Acidobacteriota bacterium]
MQSRRALWIFIGLIGGLTSSLVGIGGGIIFVPALHLWGHLALKSAIATSVACIVPIAAVGALSHGLVAEGPFPWIPAICLSATAVFTAQLGVASLKRISSNTMSYMFAGLLIFTAVRMLLSGETGQGTTTPPLWVFPMIGVVSGFASSLLGIGGGVVMVGAMVGLCDAPMIWSVTVSLTAMVPTTLSGLWAHHRAQLIHWPAVLPLSVPAIAAAFLGARLAHILPTVVLEGLFGFFLVYATVRILKRARVNPEVNLAR